MFALFIIFRSTQSLNSYTEFDDSFNAKTPSKCPDGTKAKKKASVSSNGEGGKCRKKGVVVDAVNGPNNRNEKSVDELESNGIECTHHNACNKLDCKLNEIENDKLTLENTISCLEVRLSDSMAQQSVKEKELRQVSAQKEDVERQLTILKDEASLKSSQISKLTEDLNIITQDNLTLEEQVERDKMVIESEKKELEEKCTFLHFTQEQLHTQVQTLQNEVSTLNDNIAALKLKLKETSNSLEIEKTKMAEVTDTYVKENMEAENEFKRLMLESNQLKSHVKNLQSEKNLIETKNVQVEKDLEEVKIKFDSLLKAEIHLTSTNESLKSDCDVLMNDKDALSEELKRVEEEKNGVAFDLASISKEKIGLEDEVAGLKTERNAVLNEIQALLSEKEGLEEQLRKATDDLSRCQEQLSSLFESSEELQNIATEQKEKLSKKEKEIQDLNGEIQELDMKNSSLEGSLSSAQSEVANLESENKTLLISFESVEDSLRTYIHRCEDLNIEIQELTCCKDDLNQTCIILERRMLDAETALKNSVGSMEGLVAQITNKDTEINKFILQTTELESKVMDLQELVGLLEQRNLTAQEVHEETFQNVEKENKEFFRQKSDLKVRIDELLTTVNKITEERAQLVEMNDELSHEVSDNLHTIKTLQEREQELNARLQLVCKDLESVKSGMSLELEQHWEAEDEILQLQAEMEQTNVQLQEATNQITSFKSQVVNLKDRNVELEYRLDSLNGTNKCSLEEIAELQEKLKTRCDEIEQLNEHTLTLKDLEVKLKNTEIESNRAKLDVANKIEEISNLSGSLIAKQNIIREYEKKTEYLKDDLKDAEIVFSRCQEMESLLKEYMNDVKELEEKTESNKKEIKIKDDLIHSLRSQLDPLQEETQTYKEKYEAICNLIEPFKEQLDSFEVEKAVLLEKNKEAEVEVKKLATQYGQLLGHQNHKQKIQHLVKLKEENIAMREEMSRMRIELDKYKRLGLKSVSSLQSHDKENSSLLSCAGNISTLGAGRTPGVARSVKKSDCKENQPLKVKIFSSTPFRRQTIASPLSIRNRELSE